MKALKKFFHDLIIWTMIFLLGPWSFISCTNDLFGMNKPVAVELDRTLIEFQSLTAAQAATQVLTAAVNLAGGTTSTDVKWDVRTLAGPENGLRILSSSGGRLTFSIDQEGEYEIIATSAADSSISESCIVRVMGYLQSLTICEENGSAITETLRIASGVQTQLSVLYNPASTTQKDVVWTVSDNQYLDIDPTTDRIDFSKGAGRDGDYRH